MRGFWSHGLHQWRQWLYGVVPVCPSRQPYYGPDYISSTSKNSVRMLGKLWEQLEHHISMGYEISETTYSGTAEKLLYRTGQGSCSSPILWAILNQLILTALGEKIECITLVSVDKSKTSTIPGNSFVDDTTGG
jgi:hypothetical protein